MCACICIKYKVLCLVERMGSTMVQSHNFIQLGAKAKQQNICIKDAVLCLVVERIDSTMVESQFHTTRCKGKTAKY